MNIMDANHPIYSSMPQCVEVCGSLVSNCHGHAPDIECQLNLVIFFLVIILAVLTGLLMPISCLLCWIKGFFGKSKDDTSSLCLKNAGFRRTGNGNDEERSSLYPSSPPTNHLLEPSQSSSQQQKCRQPSSFSLPPNDTVVEMDLEQKQRRCRKITFDMTQRVNEFSQL